MAHVHQNLSASCTKKTSSKESQYFLHCTCATFQAVESIMEEQAGILYAFLRNGESIIREIITVIASGKQL
jgi:hypothetical protein